MNDNKHKGKKSFATHNKPIRKNSDQQIERLNINLNLFDC
jgi:hypothetical protein